VVIARAISKPSAPLIPWSPRRSVPWAFIDFFLLVGLWILSSVVVRYALKHWALIPVGLEMDELASEGRRAVLVGNVAVSLSIIGIGLPLIAVRTGAAPRDFGWSLAHLLTDLRLGLIGFILFAPPVYALQGLLVNFWKPSHHPLVELFKGAPDPLFFGLLFLSAAIVAPLFEELAFRVLWQGFLEKWLTFSYSAQELLLGNECRYGRLASDEAASPFLPTEPAPVTTATDSNPYASPLNTDQPDNNEIHESPDEQPELCGGQAWLPIGISSTVFALLHYSHGPDWIPLLLLAAGMGYLYQRTHRLLPSLVVHCLLNSYSLWGLWIQVQAEAAKH
jgi:membrane protease YdiL (CAAX protease family)